MTHSGSGAGGGSGSGSGSGAADSSSKASDSWERLSALYETAQSLAPRERAAYVADACPDDPALQRELVALLSAGEGADAFLDDLAAEVVAPLLDEVVSAPSSPQSERDASRAVEEAAAAMMLRAGSAIRHFEILGELGRGGMGVVYRARDQRLDRAVAIKVVGPEAFASPDARERLMEEARAVSALDDPNVCSLYAIEDTGDGGLCLIMALCSNGTLRERLKAAPLSVPTALDIAHQLASGLAAAHRQGIVHRDLKPANIGFADQDVVKLLDFGVAVRPTDSRATRSVGGTLAYMAPELVRLGEATPRSDVWSLGVVLFEMLTGRRPFSGASRADVQRAICDAPVPEMVRPDGAPIPEGMQELVRQLLQRDPAARPADAAAVRQLLGTEANANAAPLSMPPASTPHAGTPHAGTPHASTPPSSAAAPLAGSRALPRVLAVAAGLAVAIAGWTFTRGGRAAAAPSAPLELVRSNTTPQPVAVLPFIVRGDASLGYLREGMVDLLTPALDATGLLRGIDPQAVLAAAPSGDSLSGSPAGTRLRDALRALGAERYVTGSLVEAGAALTLRATLRDVDGTESARASVTLASAADLLTGVDDLVRQLVAMELSAPGDTIGGIAAATTGSVVALRAFLDGERELRDARPLAAIAQFSEAVALDSTFALAWYRLARAARWGAVDSLNQLATDRAFALSASLPYRWQTIVGAYHEMQRGSVVRATRTFRDLAAMYPSDVEVAMLLGEALFHDNPYHGRPSSEAEEWFRRVMSLDPQNRELTVYLMDLAARRNATGALDTLFTMYFDPNSAGEEPGVRQTYLALHARRVLQQRASNAVLLDNPLTAQTALRRIANDDRDLSAARGFARTMTTRSAPTPVRVEGWLALATLAASSGAWSDAAESWAQAADLDSTAAIRHRALTLLAWPLSAGRDALNASADALRGDLARHRAPAAGGVAGSQPERASGSPMRLASAEHLLLNWYLIGLLRERLQDTSGVAYAREQIDALPTSPRLSAPLREALTARQWLARGDTARALAAFANSEVDVPVSLRRRYPSLEQHADRFDRAELLYALGQHDRAEMWYRSVTDGFALWGVPYRGRVAPQLRAIASAKVTSPTTPTYDTP